MEGIDRLGWAAGFSFESYGLRLGVRVNDQSVLARIVESLPPGWKATRSPNPREIYSLFVGSAARAGVKRFHLVDSLVAIERALSQTRALKGFRGEADEAADRLLRALDAQPRPPANEGAFP